MDSNGVLIGQMYRKMQKSAHIMVDTLGAMGLIRRQPEGETTADLSSGAIVGIAVGGSAILFGILVMIIIHCVRLRQKRSRRSTRVRDLDLSDDNEEDVLEALRSTRPPDLNLTRPRLPNLADVDNDPARKEWGDENKLFGPPLARPPLMPPAYAFQITGLRDSWPLAGWVPNSGPALTVENRSVIEANCPGKRSLYSTVISTQDEPTWPQPTLSPSTPRRTVEDKSIRRSNHSTYPSVNSLNMLSYNRSVSDSQLTSILRSTSQRLRDAQRRSTSRVMNVMSQGAGTSPELKPSSPPADQLDSQEALVGLKSSSDADSVRSSILNVTSGTPGAGGKSGKSVGSTTGLDKPTAPDEVKSDAVSLPEVSDLLVLAPPSKERALFDQISGSETPSATKDSSTQPGEDNGVSLEATGRGVATDSYPLDGTSFEDDPFTYSKDLFQTKPLSANSHTRGSPHIEQKYASGGSDSRSFPLRDISGNKTSPNKPGSVLTDASLGKNLKTFQWSSDIRSLMASLGQKPTGIQQKGHRRRRTVRYAHVPRQVSVGVVVEGPERDIVPTQKLNTITKSVSGNNASSGPLSRSRSQIEIRHSNPTSIPLFQPSFLEFPPAEAQLESKRSSEASYSATLSLYDLYSSGGPSRLSQAGLPPACPSPTPSIKKARRRGRNFSIDTSKANSLALTSFPPLKPVDSVKPVEYDGTLESLIQDLPPPEESVSDNPILSRPAGNGRLFGPRALPKPTPVDSVTSSISLLRRMNSEVSTYSASSSLSGPSRESPTIPQLSDRGTSPTRLRQAGSINYLSIGNKSSYARSRRGLGRELGVTPEVEPDVDGFFENQGSDPEPMSLKMPVLDHPPTLSSRSLERQSNPPQVSYRPKTPVAQLRPAGTSVLALGNCQTCNDPLSASSTSQHHDHCLRCTICNNSLEPRKSYAVDHLRYCSDHYLELIRARSGNNIDRVSANEAEKHGDNKDRWSTVMATPQKTSVRRESRLEMPAPKGLSPKSVIEWRDSCGLYDDMGFLRASPDRMRNLSPNTSPLRGRTPVDLGLQF